MEPMSGSADEWARLGEAKFLSFGTFRANGELVRTPVWIAPLEHSLVLTTEVSTGKVRRLRRDDRVVATVCDRFGALVDGAPDVAGRAVLVDDDARTAAAMRSLRRKYGVQVTLVLALERTVRRFQRRPGRRIVVEVTHAD